MITALIPDKKVLKRFGKFKIAPYLCTAFEEKHNKFGLWCNGSTTVFGSVCLGSNPGSPTIHLESSERLTLGAFFFLLIRER